MSKLQILHDFKTSLVQFIDELREQFPQEGDLVILRILLNDQMPIEDIMEKFISKILPFSDMIRKRDETFFLTNNSIFENINSSKVNHFKDLWKSDTLEPEDRDVIWEWYNLFVSLGEKYASL